MHIIALEFFPTALRGGKEISMMNVCHGLSQRGHTVSLVFVENGDLVPKYQSFCNQVVQTGNWYLYPKKVDSAFVLLKSVLTTVLALRSIKRKESLIYFDDYRYAFFAYLLSLLLRVPLALHFRYPSQTIFHRQHQIAFKGINQFIAVSNYTKNEWIQTGIVSSSKIDVVYNGIDPAIFIPAKNKLEAKLNFINSPGSKIISYIGRIDKVKNLETLIKAYAKLPEIYREQSHLLIAGRPVDHSSKKSGEEYKTSLEKLALTLGVSERVDFLGHLANPLALYQASDLTVLPSSYSEPFGRSIIESMACGVPVIASAVGGISEILSGEFEAHLFNPANDEELVLKMQDLLDWEVSNPLLGNKCRDYVEKNFTLERALVKIETLLMNMISEKK